MTSNDPNYIVTTQSWKGVVVTGCSTIEEVWNAIGDMSFGGLYEVHSPKDLDTLEFVPL